MYIVVDQLKLHANLLITNQPIYQTLNLLK